MNYKPLIASVGGAGAAVVQDPGVLHEALSGIITIVAGTVLYLLTNWFEKLKNKNNGKEK